MLNQFETPSWDMEDIFLMLNFKHINLHLLHLSPAGLKTLLSTIARSTAYPGPPAAGSPPFVITLFLSGIGVHSVSSLFLGRGQGQGDIVDDIIKPFLPLSAPHLVHIPKIFFISSEFGRQYLATQPPLFPGDCDANYLIAYHQTSSRADMSIWMQHITDNLLTGQSVQEVVEKSRSCLDHDIERLHYFSSLKDSNLVIRK